MAKIPKSHPRYKSIVLREKIVQGVKQGLVHETGLIAHGRGEAFDYLIGEKTNPIADKAEQVAAAAMITAKKPVISINGNTVVLAGQECVELAAEIPSLLEVNLFHRTSERMKKIMETLKDYGVEKVLGGKGDAHIPGLEHDRGICDREGIFSADVILVPLEDGDRCQALKKMNKTVIAIDLNPLSRTAKTADITIVDNVTRAIPNITKWVKNSRKENMESLEEMVTSWDNQRMLQDFLDFVSKRLNSRF